MSRTLLLDADLLAYRATAALQQTIDWNGDGSCVSLNGRENEVKQNLALEIERTLDGLDAGAVVICLSDEVSNFRRTMVDPTYKTHRTGERPVLLYEIKEWLADSYPIWSIPQLEADDVMGILATEPHKGDRIMVSVDKDMKTVPGLLCVPPRGDDKWTVRSISEAEADRFHLYQTLVGDATDGYPGCPGCGPVAAERLLSGEAWVGQCREITKGKRAGEIDVKWKLEPSETVELSPWGCVTSAYGKAGLDEAAAVKQARLAFILRSSHHQDGRIRLWAPPRPW